MILVAGKKIEFERFPNGERLIPTTTITWVNYPKTPHVVMIYESDTDLLDLMFVSSYLDDLGLKETKKLVIPYFPYSRMDRTENRSAFTLKYVTGLINSMNFSSVELCEPHSDVVLALLNNVSYRMVTSELFSHISFDKENDYIYFPDSGAEKRYSKLYKGYKYIVGHKTRDFETGKIVGLEIFPKPEGIKKVVMIDDLCSYGGTFFLGATELRKMGVEHITLVVGHCENSIFDGKLLKGNEVDVIITSNSIPHSQTHEKIKVYNV